MSQPALAIQEDEIRAFHDLAATFARDELADRLLDHEYPYPCQITGVIEKLSRAGLFGINLPIDWGGTGLDAHALAGILEQISTVDAGIAGMLFTHAAALEIISIAAADDEAKASSIYQPVADADSVPLAFQSYHSPDEIDFLAVTGEARHLLSGKLSFLVLGGLARYGVVPGARQTDGGFAYYLVDLYADGVAKSAPILTLGLQAAQAVDVTFSRVPARLIGSENKGPQYFHTMRSRMSRPAAAISVGIMDGSFRAALDYARQRYQGGRNIVDWSGVRMKLADMAILIEVSRCCLSAEAAPAVEAAAAIHIGGLACSVTVEGVQLLGGNGYMKDYGQEKRMRDARQARSLLGMSSLKKMDYIRAILEETNR